MKYGARPNTDETADQASSPPRVRDPGVPARTHRVALRGLDGSSGVADYAVAVRAVRSRVVGMTRMMAPTLHTPRLTLRHFTPGDVDALHAITGRADTMTYYVDNPTPGTGWDIGRAAAFLTGTRDSWDRNGYGRWAVDRDGTLAGYCGFVDLDWLPEFGEAVELSFRFHPDQWGQGVGPEAAAAALDWAFTVPALDRVVAATTTDNTRSHRALTKLGMVQVGEFPYTSATSGRAAVFALYEITRQAWTNKEDE